MWLLMEVWSQGGTRDTVDAISKSRSRFLDNLKALDLIIATGNAGSNAMLR